MRLVLLGTMGWMPGDRRETTCLACRDGDRLLLFDAGTGLRRLLEPRNAALLEGADEVHLFLSHYHLDHTCGLAYLPGVLPGRELTLHPPAASVTGLDPEAALAGLLRKPYNPRDWADLPGLRVEPLAEGSQEVAGHEVRVRRQRHSDTSVGVRVDDAFAIATDTAADEGTAELASGVQLLLHEAWYSAADPAAAALPAGNEAHSEAGAVGRLAAAAGAGRLVLIHLNPLSGEPTYRRLAADAARSFAATELHDDGDTVFGPAV